MTSINPSLSDMQSALRDALAAYWRLLQFQGAIVMILGVLVIEKLALLPVWRDAGKLFSDDECAALAWAETVTRAGETRVPDEEFDAAVLQFSDKELIDLTIAIGFMNAYRLSISFPTPPLAAALRRGTVNMRRRRAPGASPDSLSDDK